MKRLLLAAMFVMAASVAQAQVVNPTGLAWDDDVANRTVTTRYDVGYFFGTATAPVQTVSVPIASTTGSGTAWQTTLPRPVLGTFTAKMKACGAAVPSGEVCSDWSNATAPFVLTPKAPVNPRPVP
jgi:hypothetical protein